MVADAFGLPKIPTGSDRRSWFAVSGAVSLRGQACSTYSATILAMETIGVRELRQLASRYLARVEAGEELAVTNNGRLVARLIPVRAAERSRAALIESGALIPARRPRNLLDVNAIRPGEPERNLSDVLREMRDER